MENPTGMTTMGERQFKILNDAERKYQWLKRQDEILTARIAKAKLARNEVATGYEWPDASARAEYNGLVRQRKALRSKIENLVMSVPV